ncbi:hypothetical protein GCM10027565_15950 [Bordetella tumulicola]
MPHLQQDLGQSGNTRRGFAVTNIRLGRTQRAELTLVSIATKRLRQRGDFYGIAQLGTCAMRLDIANMPGIDARLFHRHGDHRSLKLGIGHRVAVGLAPMVERATLDHAIDMIAVALGVGQALEHDHAHAFARNVAVAPLAKALARAITRNVLPGAEDEVFVGMHA